MGRGAGLLCLIARDAISFREPCLVRLAPQPGQAMVKQQKACCASCCMHLASLGGMYKWRAGEGPASPGAWALLSEGLRQDMSLIKLNIGVRVC